VQIAQKTGGEYFHADSKRFGVDEIAQALAGLKRFGERGAHRPSSTTEAFELAAAAGLLAARGRGLHERAAPAGAAAGANGSSGRAAEAGRGAGGSGTRARSRSALALWPLLAGFEPLRSRNGEVEQGNALMKSGHCRRGPQHYENAVAALPAEPGAHLRKVRGAALYARQRFDEAGQSSWRATKANDGALKTQAF